MSVEIRAITAEELWAMPGGERYELVRGELHTLAPAGFEHGAIITNLNLLIAQFVKERNLGVVLGAETGFVLSRNPDVVRGADVAFVRADRIPASGLPKHFWEGAPDLAVEVLSPGDSAQEVEEKIDDYLSAGTRLLWVLNPRRRTATVYRPGQDPRILREHETVDGQDVLRGFSFTVADAYV